MDFQKLIGKPYLINSYNWTTTQSVGDQVFKLSIPDDIRMNSIASVPFKTATYFNTKMCVILQVSGTPMHSGTLVAAAMPHDIVPSDVNQFLMAPHGFMSANESSAICVEVPWYSPQNVMRTFTETGETPITDENYADIYVQVVNPLKTNGSTILTVSVHLMFESVNFYIPKPSAFTWVPQSDEHIINSECVKRLFTKVFLYTTAGFFSKFIAEYFFPSVAFEPEGYMEDLMRIPTRIFDGLSIGAKSITGDFIDSLRLGLRTLTGFHNPNSPAINSRMISTQRNFMNNVDQPNLFEKLDQHAQHDRITQDTIFGTEQDEMDIKYILEKKSYVDTFVVNANDVAGTRLFTRPITPMIEAERLGYTSAMRTFYESSRYWRGSLKIYIQSAMTNFQYLKLLVVKNYTGNNTQLTSYVPMSACVNMMSDTLEFSAGGQILEVELPYCAVSDQLECTKYLNTNALIHGLYTIYLMQPLTTNDASPLNAEFNVYIGPGEDFQFYGYATDRTFINGMKPVSPFFANREEDLTDLESLDLQIRKMENEKENGQLVINKNNLKVDSLKNTAGKLAESMEKEYDSTDILTYIDKSYPFTTQQEIVRFKRLSAYLVKNVEEKHLKQLKNFIENSTGPKKMFLTVLERNLLGTFEPEAETTVTQSSQDDILNQDVEETGNDLRAVDFKPMVSVRDYVRRMVPWENYFFNTDTTGGLFTVSIKDLLKRISLRSSTMNIVDLFWGMNGGLKVKIVLTGCCDGHIYYIPPSTAMHANDFTPDKYSDTFPGNFTNPANSIFATSMKYVDPNLTAFGFPAQEASQHHVSIGTNNRSENDCEFEFVIPNMNPYRFIAGKDLYPDTVSLGDVTSDLGHILIAPHVDSSENIGAEIWMGFTDETRFGYQVFSSYKRPILTGDNVSGTRVTGYNINRTPYAPAVGTATMMGAYYTKTV